MKAKKSIKNLEAKNLGGFKKAFGHKIYGGCTTWTLKEVVIIVKRPRSIEGDDVTNDGSDGNGPC